MGSNRRVLGEYARLDKLMIADQQCHITAEHTIGTLIRLGFPRAV